MPKRAFAGILVALLLLASSTGEVLRTAIAQTQSNPALEEKHGTLEIGDFQVPKGAQICGLEVDLAGAFEGISSIPVGWTSSVDNDSSWKAKFVANAKAGSPPINEATLRNFGLIVRLNGLDDGRPQAYGWITVVDLSRKAQKRLPLSSYSFNFDESYHRHLLGLDLVHKK